MLNTDEIEFEALAWPDRAKALQIADEAGFRRAAEMLTGIKALRARIEETFGPIIKKAHSAWQEAIKQRRQHEDPLTAAEATIKIGIARYQAEGDRRRRDEERRLAEIARKADEDARLEEAERLEAAGELELAERVIEAPSIAPTPILPPAVKVDGVVTRKIWRAEVTDVRALCKAVAEGTAAVTLVEPNRPALNKMAVALKEGFAVPGCRAVAETSVAASAR